MHPDWTYLRRNCKALLIAGLLPVLAGCTTNPATGEQQFAALMSPQQEVRVGAEEHEKVIKQFGLYNDPALVNYVGEIGRRVTRNTERPDVQYKFFIVDSPIVNAFALPGGYIYVSRGLLALANSEAELAAVLAHETGHIPGRHSAERYSRGVVTSLGAAVLAAAIGNDTASQALGVGSDLFLKSYSRGQENEADSLGMRYLSRAGYDPKAMAAFLANLQEESALQTRISGFRRRFFLDAPGHQGPRCQYQGRSGALSGAGACKPGEVFACTARARLWRQRGTGLCART